MSIFTVSLSLLCSPDQRIFNSGEMGASQVTSEDPAFLTLYLSVWLWNLLPATNWREVSASGGSPGAPLPPSCHWRDSHWFLFLVLISCIWKYFIAREKVLPSSFWGSAENWCYQGRFTWAHQQVLGLLACEIEHHLSVLYAAPFMIAVPF